MSAQCNLAGLFPPTNEELWNPNINWQPIPVHTIPKKMDHVLSVHKPCPAYEEEFSSVANSEEFLKVGEQFNHLYEYLSEHTGRTVDSLAGIQIVHNTLSIEAIYNKT